MSEDATLEALEMIQRSFAPGTQVSVAEPDTVPLGVRVVALQGDGTLAVLEAVKLHTELLANAHIVEWAHVGFLIWLLEYVKLFTRSATKRWRERK